MPKFANASLEAAALERDACRHESNLARLYGRGKFTGCPECGSNFGMFSTTREEMEQFLPGAIEHLAPWYREPGNSLVLYHLCFACNWRGSQGVPDDLEPLSVTEVLAWFNRDPMASDYEALAAEEPMSR